METAGFTEGEMELMQQDGVLTVRSRSVLGDGDIINLGVFRIDWLGRIHTGTLQPRTVTVYLPQTALDSFELNAGVGDVSGALPFTAQRMDISCGTGSVTLTNLQAQQLHISRGVGSVTLTDFSCETFSLTGGTGVAKLTNGGASVRADLSVGVGNVTVSGGQWNTLSVEGGAGSFVFDGSLRGVCAIEGGVGRTELDFTDTADNYEVQIRKGVGDIDVAGADLVLSGDDDRFINPGAGTGNFLTIDQGAGAIKLRFPEE